MTGCVDTGEPLLRVSDVSKNFGAVAAVRQAGFCVNRGEILTLIGPSGCGKSTILRMVAGFEKPDGGDILLDGRSVLALPPEQRGIGIVFQDYALFPHMTVLDNVAFALRRIPRWERREKAVRYLDMVGLSGLNERFPDQLSGGQQQRVALARSLAAEPRLILLDEPFSNLDAVLRQNTRAEIRAILKATGLGVVFITHDQEEALSFSDRICVMSEGVIEQSGAPAEVYAHPVNAYVAGFLGRTNLLRAEAENGRAMSAIGLLEIEDAASGPVLLSLRPEHLRLLPPGMEHPQAIVESREFKGHDVTYWVCQAGQRYQIDTNPGCPFAPGDVVSLAPRAKAVVLAD